MTHAVALRPGDGQPPAGDDRYERIAAQLAEYGWCVTSDFTTTELTSALAADARAGWHEGEFRPAGVGRAEQLAVRPGIRNDKVKWLDPGNLNLAQRAYLAQLEQLRLAINRHLYLGLFDFEGHLAVYPPGSFYRRHLDRFRDNGLRTVTVILYLNEDWRETDGGQLRLYTERDDPAAYLDVLPLAGRLACFLSGDFEHEVRPAGRERLSLTGWFRVRGNGPA